MYQDVSAYERCEKYLQEIMSFKQQLFDKAEGLLNGGVFQG